MAHKKEIALDKKFILKTILLNTAWVAWIVLSVFLGYVIYTEAFNNQPIVIIPFSLLFLSVGGVTAFFVYKFIKKRRGENSSDIQPNAGEVVSAAENGKPTQSEDADIKSIENKK